MLKEHQSKQTLRKEEQGEMHFMNSCFIYLVLRLDWETIMFLAKMVL